MQHALRQACLEAEVDTFIPMPGGEIACFSFQCWLAQGLHTDGQLDQLDRLRPHMARAAVMAARLGLGMGSFDLTLKEALLAGVLATGLSLKDAATQCGIQDSTARTHLERIFRKAGVRQ